MRAQLEAVTEELRRLRSEGVTRVPVREETLARLRVAAQPVRHAPIAEAPLVVEDAPPARRPVRASTVAAAAASPNLRWDGQPIAPLPEPPAIQLPAGSREQKMAWLRDRVLNCEVCQAHVRPGRKLVFGVGTPEAEIFFCGEGPGADEERQGEPFVGPAGQLLTKIIQAMGLSREKVYIGNVMKWRPEMPQEWGNREPTPEEVAFSLPFLRAQLEIVQPQVIVALGKTALNGILGFDPRRKMTLVRGKWQTFDGVPLMPTFHPSYLLRNQANAIKRQVWEDMLLVMEKVGMPISEKQRGFFLNR
ncbi:MAG TPA: uracil-DNA glycosylase [Opitutales bacterium]|nr:uracil-DNA glycosylase [Opitutales bacterium]